MGRGRSVLGFTRGLPQALRASAGRLKGKCIFAGQKKVTFSTKIVPENIGHKVSAPTGGLGVAAVASLLCTGRALR